MKSNGYRLKVGPYAITLWGCRFEFSLIIGYKIEVRRYAGNYGVRKGHKGFKSTLSQQQRQELLEVFIQNDWQTKAAKRWLKEKYDIELKQPTLWYMKDRLKKKWLQVNSDLDN